MRRPPLLRVALAIALAGAARAEGPAAPARYPFTLGLRAPPEALARRLEHSSSGGLTLPSNPSVDVPVGALARDAYQEMLARVGTPGAPPAAELTLQDVRSGFDLDDAGWHVWVEHQLALRTAAGEELGAWKVAGRAPILGPGEDAIPAAAARATADAARRLEAQLEQPAGVAAWLAARGVAPGTVPRPLPQGLAAEGRPAPASPARARHVLYLDAGVGVNTVAVDGGAPLLHSTASPPSFSGALGYANPWILLEATVEDFQVTPIPERAVNVLAFGVAGGPLLRVGPAELAGGFGLGGVASDYGPTDMTMQFFFSAHVTHPLGDGWRARLGLEIRKFVTGTIRRADGGELDLTYGIGHAGVTLGVEMPVG